MCTDPSSDPSVRQMQPEAVCRDALQEAGQAEGAQGWLSSSLQTTKGTDQLYGLLQQYVQKPAFLQKLTAARATAVASETLDPTMCRPSGPSSASEPVQFEADVMQATFWESAPGGCVNEVQPCQCLQPVHKCIPLNCRVFVFAQFDTDTPPV